MTRHRVLVVGRPYDLSDSPFDGFVIRHRQMVHALARHHDVSLLTLRPEHDKADICTDLASLHRAELTLDTLDTSRTARIVRALPVTTRSARHAGRRLRGAASTVRPDAVVTLGPWLEEEYRALFATFPVLHLFEEDLSAMEEIASQSLQARVLRSLLTAMQAHARPGPRVAVHISPVEHDAARRHFPRAHQLYLPFTLARAQWPLHEDASSGDTLLTVANFSELRNAEGLVAVLGELERRMDPPPDVTIVSDAGLHTSLAPFLSRPWVHHPTPAGPIVPRYRTAWGALVPSLRMSGQKTTVLQAWATGCPVICTVAASRTVDGADAVLAGADAVGVVDRIIELRANPDERARLARAGFARITDDFDPDDGERRLLEAVAELAQGASSPRSTQRRRSTTSISES